MIAHAVVAAICRSGDGAAICKLDGFTDSGNVTAAILERMRDNPTMVRHRNDNVSIISGGDEEELLGEICSRECAAKLRWSQSQQRTDDTDYFGTVEGGQSRTEISSCCVSDEEKPATEQKRERKKNLSRSEKDWERRGLEFYCEAGAPVTEAFAMELVLRRLVANVEDLKKFKLGSQQHSKYLAQTKQKNT